MGENKNKSDKKDSPKMALVNYLQAWKDEDWLKMGEYTQLTWKDRQTNLLNTLKDKHNFFKIKKFTIGENVPIPGLNNSVCVDIKAKIHYMVPKGDKKFRNTIKTKSLLARIICEKEPGRADPNGTWGVNPISIFRK